MAKKLSDALMQNIETTSGPAEARAAEETCTESLPPFDEIVTSLKQVVEQGMSALGPRLDCIIPQDRQSAYELLAKLDRLRKASDRLYTMAQEIVMTAR